MSEPESPDDVAALRDEVARLRAVAEAGRAFVHGTYPDGRPYKGGDLTNAVRAMEER